VNAALATLAPADNCFDCRVYRAIDLGPIDDPSSLELPFAGDYTFGINNLGEVVWFAEVSGNAIRAFVRLPVANHGLPAGTYQLTIPTGFTSQVPVTAACDINDAGFIAGSVGETLVLAATETQKAVVWRLEDATAGSPPTIPSTIVAPEDLELGEGGFEVGCWSHAHGLNNSSPPEIVGTVALDYCALGCDGTNFFIGFRLELDSNDVPTGLPASLDSFWSVAFAVSDETTPTIVGRDLHALAACGPIIAPEQGCVLVNDPNDGLAWTLSGDLIDELAELGYGSGDRGETFARDIDAEGHIVGLSTDLNNESQCEPFATFWQDVSDLTPLELSGFCGAPTRSRADAIVVSSQDLLRACGTDGTSALLWHRVDDVWCCNLLPEITFRPPGGSAAGAPVVAAHDISVDGYIIAHGFGPGPAQHAYLLTCAADLSGDFRVDVADLGILLGAWWDAAPTCDCSEDLNGDGFVNGADLGILGGAWSEDEPCQIQCLVSPEEMSLTGDPVAAATTALGFSTISEFVAWGKEANRAQLDAAMATIYAFIQLSQ
jgi:hypothetical protein